MFNNQLLNKGIQQFITENETQDAHQFSLRKVPFDTIKSQEISQQILGRQIAKKKFPFLLEFDLIIFPEHLNLEQSSSEFTAEYKAKLCKGKTLVDANGGFGIDAIFLTQNFEKVIFIEPNKMLISIVENNFKQLKINDNFEFINTDCEDFFAKTKQHFDCIYLDPSRRKNQSKKFLLQDLSPNILELIPNLLKITDTILVKLSPLFDSKQCIDLLQHCKEIHIVSYKNEVKELLVILHRNVNKNPKITCIETTDNQRLEYYFEDEKQLKQPKYSIPKKYLYVPHCTLLKAQNYNWIATHYQLEKLHQNTQVFTSAQLIDNFFGRIFEVIDFEYDTKKLEKKNANIISKNFPLSAEQIQKKYKMQTKGTDFVFFVQSIKKYHILLTSQIK